MLLRGTTSVPEDQSPACAQTAARCLSIRGFRAQVQVLNLENQIVIFKLIIKSWVLKP